MSDEFKDIHVGGTAVAQPESANGQHTPDLVEEVVNEEGASPLDRLRDRYRALQGEHRKDIDVPGYAGALVGRYKPIGEEAYKALRKRIAHLPEEEREITAMIDQIITACDSLWCRTDDGQLIPLDENGPVRYDMELAKILGFEFKSARSVVRKVFTVNDEFNVAALQDHSTDIGIWMTNVSAEVDDSLGER